MTRLGPLGRVVVLGLIGFLYWLGLALLLFDYSELAVAAFGWGVPFYVALWAAADSRTSRYWPAFHYSWYLFGLWPIAVPQYVLRTRGRRGLPLLALLLVLLTHWFWGYWLGIFAAWTFGWYATDDLL